MSVTLTIDHWVRADRRVFNNKKKQIQGALEGETGIIDSVSEKHKEEIFYMLMFCLCVPQSKAIKAQDAIEQLQKLDFYKKPLTLSEVTGVLTSRVRFQSTKAKRLMEARKSFLESDFWEKLKHSYGLLKKSSGKYATVKGGSLDGNKYSWEEAGLHATRNFLIKNVNGMGMKLASHFMRNVGMSGLAILDVHVIDGLKKRGVIDIDKLGPSKQEYLDIEQKMKDYAEQVGIKLDELDLLLWSQKTGYVFK